MSNYEKGVKEKVFTRERSKKEVFVGKCLSLDQNL